jgi:Zn-finger nucleic acid-binding protein
MAGVNQLLCPVCPNHRLHAVSADSSSPLPANRCAQCHGHWIRGEAYYTWIEQTNRATAATLEVRDVAPAHDNPRAKLCPECRKIMRRYEVGHGVEFCIDRCATCAGIWFDANEWEQLQAHKLADRVHFIFSAAWQSELHRQRHDERERVRLRARLGEEDFERLQQITQWVQNHPHRDELAAHLIEMIRQAEPTRIS